ncbi:MAG: pyridoxal-phosphate dependent enzyme [Cyclobacteriaceae bacterium]|nr:pyridoxal-phosphate dependent enzyme [Cyclobacteriaceae bacterium]
MQLPVANTPLVPLRHPLLESREIEIWIKRDDLTHPEIMGNKWRKLKYNLREARESGKDTLVTYGGAYSNHIAATAAAGKIFDFHTIGIIRGDELHPASNPTLRKAAENGMKLLFVSRQEFRQYKTDLDMPGGIPSTAYVLPEGGTNHLAIQGCREIVDEIEIDFDILVTAMGTGGTFAGLASGLDGRKQLWGVSALKGAWVHREANALLTRENIFFSNFKTFDDHVFGGYGQFNPYLIQFILNFRKENNILLDPVYTGKMFLCVWDMINNDQIAKGSRLILLHTGGLQGIEGFNFQHQLKIPMA